MVPSAVFTLCRSFLLHRFHFRTSLPPPPPLSFSHFLPLSSESSEICAAVAAAAGTLCARHQRPKGERRSGSPGGRAARREGGCGSCWSRSFRGDCLDSPVNCVGRVRIDHGSQVPSKLCQKPGLRSTTVTATRVPVASKAAVRSLIYR